MYSVYWNGKSLNPYYLAMVTQRGYDRVLIPVYDLINHHNNPDKINVVARPSIYSRDGFGAYSLKDLSPNDELYYSYQDSEDFRQCEVGKKDCKSTINYWGTPESKL